MDIKYPVMCPLMKREISSGVFFDIHMVVCGEAPKRTAPKEVFDTENYCEICNGCKYHRED